MVTAVTVTAWQSSLRQQTLEEKNERKIGFITKKAQESGRNHELFNKKRIKTWWIREIVVTLHPLFVAPVPGGVKFNIKF